jgi:DNA-binding MarR family transcriptional regulator
MDEASGPLAAIERGMVRLRRAMGRRTLGNLATRRAGAAVDLANFSVVDAIEEGPPGPDAEVTVGLVAERLGVDPSRASRLVAAAIRAGYVRRVASQADGRRIHLELTASGRRLAESGHRTRRERFDLAMAGWSAADREAFGRLLTRFADGLAAAAAQEAGSPARPAAVDDATPAADAAAGRTGERSPCQ